MAVIPESDTRKNEPGSPSLLDLPDEILSELVFADLMEDEYLSVLATSMGSSSTRKCALSA